MGKWINKVGIEVECGVYRDEVNQSIPGFDRTGDGSLRSSDGVETELLEYVSEAHKYPGQLPDLEAGVSEIYDIVNDINDSMGLHIHVSFNRDEFYYRIASKKFHDFFVARIRESDLWDDCPRLRKRIEGGENDVRPSEDCDYYCKAIEDYEDIDNQLHRNGSNLKYKRIVYFKHKYDTVEFRLFPAMESAENVMRAVNLTTTSINKFLQETRYTEQAEIKSSIDKEREEKTYNV